MAKEIKHSICFQCKPRCRLEVEVEDNQVLKLSTSPIKKCPRKCCHGFEELAARAREYPVDRVSEITWVPKKEIVTAPRMSATNKSSCAMEGMGVAHQANSYGAIAARGGVGTTCAGRASSK